MDEQQDQAFMEGKRTAWLQLFQLCVENLGDSDTVQARTRWIVEREQAIAALRAVCRDHGDNDWSDDSNIASIIQNHLASHLEK